MYEVKRRESQLLLPVSVDHLQSVLSEYLDCTEDGEKRMGTVILLPSV